VAADEPSAAPVRVPLFYVLGSVGMLLMGVVGVARGMPWFLSGMLAAGGVMGLLTGGHQYGP